jgi:hypothetical protein
MLWIGTSRAAGIHGAGMNRSSVAGSASNILAWPFGMGGVSHGTSAVQGAWHGVTSWAVGI